LHLVYGALVQNGKPDTYGECEKAAKRIADMLQRRALSSAPAREQWQPIETAPKDGRKLLLWWAGMSRVGRCAGVGASRDGGDWWQVPSLECAPTGRPTHWMPLPAAPGATTEPAPAREPMTDEQVYDLNWPADVGGFDDVREIVRQVERHHGICKE
jgi:hypothetical protein